MDKPTITYTVKYDRSIPVEEIPEDFSIEATCRENAFALLREELMCDEFPLEDVLEDGESVFDEFNEYIDFHSQDD
jgi:hypothetical protein